MQLGSSLGAMIGRRIVDIALGLEVSEKKMPSFLGGKLSFLKLGSVLVGFSGGGGGGQRCQIVVLRSTVSSALYDKSIHVEFHLLFSDTHDLR